LKDRGFRTKIGSEIYLEGCLFMNNYFEGGFIIFDTNDETKFGKYQSVDTEFIGMKGPQGGIVNVGEIGIHSDIKCLFFRCYFERNSVEYHGGIIYSTLNKTSQFVTFENCTFHDNSAKHGININIYYFNLINMWFFL